jgi:hypothetical protein
VQHLHKFRIEFSNAQAEAIKYITSITRSKGMVSRDLKMQMISFIKECVGQSESFVDFLGVLLVSSNAVKANPPSQEVIRHMIRESKYFIGIEQLII